MAEVLYDCARTHAVPSVFNGTMVLYETEQIVPERSTMVRLSYGHVNAQSTSAQKRANWRPKMARPSGAKSCNLMCCICLLYTSDAADDM
eukprot:2548603-Rhodomonas_salina.1